MAIFPYCVTAENNYHPKIGLVLSGGGAKGGAHIGVLKVIDDLNIPIDYVVGTSMGAVVGALYASGYSGQEIELILTTVKWDSILRNKVDRKNIYYRRKRDDDLFLIGTMIGLKKGRLYFSTGIVQGHDLYQTFKKHTIGQEPIESFDQLSIPFRAVATDLLTGDTVVLSHGDLAKAMVASMSVPGLFSPVEIDGKILVDGGVSSNLPIETAKSMGADILIVVDVGSLALTSNQIINFKSVLSQLTNIYVRKNIDESLKLLSERDIIILPNMEGISTAEYDELNQAILVGIQATLEKESSLKQYSSNEKWKRTIPAYQFNLNGISIFNQTRLSNNTFYEYLPITPGLYNTDQIDIFISRLYGLEMFETIDYGIYNDSLVVVPYEKKWGPTFLQASLSLATDFEGNSSFELGAALTRTLLNPLAGEIRFFGSIGESNHAFLEWYQPFTYDLAWFVNPQIRFSRQPFGFFLSEEEMARYLVTTFSGVFAIGRNFREWGRAEVGYVRGVGSARVKVGVFAIPEFNFDKGSTYARFEWDTLDNSFFPHEGANGSIQYEWHRKAFGSDQKFDIFSIRSTRAMTYGKHTGVFGARYETTPDGTSSLSSQFLLGGLFRLSGLVEDQLYGQEAALFTAIYYYRLKDFDFIPNYPFPLYFGLSLETGNAWEDRASLLKHSFRNAGSVFLGFNTIIGPLYLAYGFAENGKRAAHLYMGRPF